VWLVTSTSNHPTRQAPKPATWAYAESFVPESGAGQAARTAASELRLTVPTRGAAQVLTFLARVINAKAVVEIGTGTGVGALALLAGMAPDGVLTTIDPEAEHQNIARKVVAQTGVRPQRLRTIAGSPLSVLPKLTDGAYDLVLVNGDRLEYPEHVEQALRLLRHGGILIVHHALLGGAVADPSDEADETLTVRDVLAAVTEDLTDLTPVLLPVGDGVLAVVKG
jgi:predicted O-methyltransferase YrrM